MLQQMLAEDKADMVREAVVKSLGIIMGYIDDPDKYSQVCVLWEESVSELSIKCSTLFLIIVFSKYPLADETVNVSNTVQ